MFPVNKKNILVFDIETIGDNPELMSQSLQSYLFKYADTEEKRVEAIESFALNPLTSTIASIGMMDYNTGNGCVYMNIDEDFDFQQNHPNFKYLKGSEQHILRKFWEIISVRDYNLFVTFNGREFDCPFIMLRSIYHKIKPSCNLMCGSDYSKDNHLDLLKEFTFYTHSGRGARRKFSLEFYCNKFGIPSPKCDGISGEFVGEMYRNKEYQKIADYCISDIKAEAQLFTFWNEYFNI